MCPQSAACWPIQLGKFHICMYLKDVTYPVDSKTKPSEPPTHFLFASEKCNSVEFLALSCHPPSFSKKKCNENGWFYLCSTVAHGCTFPISSRKICDSPAGRGNRRGRSDIMSTRLLFSRRGFAYATECLPSSQYVSTRRIRNKLNKCNHQWQIG